PPTAARTPLRLHDALPILAAGIQAWQDSGLEVTEANAERIGVIVGSGIGGLPRIEETQTELLAKGPRRISPFFVPGSLINLISRSEEHTSELQSRENLVCR